MAKTITVPVPDIGDFENVAVIEVLVSPGDRVEEETSLITLESDKATMEIPSPAAGIVRELLVAVDDEVSEGSPILRLELLEEETAEAPDAAEAGRPAGEEAEAPARAEADAPREETARASEREPAERPARRPGRAPGRRAPRPAAGDAEGVVLVLGAGPGGYTAAFRAADLGRRVVLVERYPTLGGVCLNVGCIPSKALLHVAEVIQEAAALGPAGVDFDAPALDFAKLRAHKDAAVKRLTKGLAGMAEQRGVEVVTGTARFAGDHEVVVETADGERRIAFDHAIVAAGSRPARLPGLPDDPRVLDSTSALEVDGEAERLLVVGGGIIGLEMAAVYAALGSEVTVVELLPQLMTGADPDLVRPLERRIARQYAGVHTETRLAGVEAKRDGLHVRLEGKKAPEEAVFDRVLVAVGRRPNGDRIGAEAAGLSVDEHGFLATDDRQRTNVPHIHAIGDVTHGPMLAHKAMHEGKVAAEVICGLPAAFDAVVPSVAYTDPEVAWVGVTEAQAQERGLAVEKAVFPWTASGRALGIGRSEGLTKLLFDGESGRLVGAGIVGPNAGELVAEATLAIEMGADAEDMALTIHPHPTLSETLGLAAQLADGSITDLPNPAAGKREKRSGQRP